MDRPLLSEWGNSSEESEEDTREERGRRRVGKRRGGGANGWREDGAVLTDDLAREVGYAEEEERA